MVVLKIETKDAWACMAPPPKPFEKLSTILQEINAKDEEFAADTAPPSTPEEQKLKFANLIEASVRGPDKLMPPPTFAALQSVKVEKRMVRSK